VSKSRIVDRLTGDTPTGVFPMQYLCLIYERENLKTEPTPEQNGAVFGA
jgi:hypothetical protein